MLSPRRCKRQVENEKPNISRTKTPEIADATITAPEIARSLVVSRIRKVRVRGPPTTPVATAAIPTTAANPTSTCIPIRAAPIALIFPINAPKNSDAKNRPPRKPAPKDMADAIDFKTRRPTSAKSPKD